MNSLGLFSASHYYVRVLSKQAEMKRRQIPEQTASEGLSLLAPREMNGGLKINPDIALRSSRQSLTVNSCFCSVFVA